MLLAVHGQDWPIRCLTDAKTVLRAGWASTLAIRDATPQAPKPAKKLVVVVEGFAIPHRVAESEPDVVDHPMW